MLKVVEKLRTSFKNHKTLPIEYRVGQLNALRKLLEENKAAILDAVYKDLHKVSLFSNLTYTIPRSYMVIYLFNIGNFFCFNF